MNAPLFLSALPAVNGSVLDFLHTTKGPDFLAVFFGWLIVVRGVVGILRRRGFDNWGTTIVGLLCFEALGVARILIGTFHGMHKWDFLILMMMFGSLCFIIRAKHFPRSNDPSGGSSSCSTVSSISSCSSGGGGGCGGGGGGCGGCGGS